MKSHTFRAIKLDEELSRKSRDTAECFVALFFFSPEKLALLSLLEEVKPCPDRKIIKLLTFDNLFPPRHSR